MTDKPCCNEVRHHMLLHCYVTRGGKWCTCWTGMSGTACSCRLDCLTLQCSWRAS